MNRTISVFQSLLLILPLAAHAQGERSPYADIQNRPIKALSAEQVEEFLQGNGMGFALPAELNGYPGPRHIIDLADSLNLSAQQRDSVQSVFERMEQRAKALGAEIVRLEGALEKIFADRSVFPDTLSTLTSLIAARTGELRAVHLAAHLHVTPLLSADQMMAYQRLRGYGHLGHNHPGAAAN